MSGVAWITPSVIPAQAGIQSAFEAGPTAVWIPAFAGMTKQGGSRCAC